MERLGGHMTNVPPGVPFLFHLLEGVFDNSPLATALQRVLLPYQCQNFDLLNYTPAQWASSLLGMLMPLWSALTVVPLYAVARRFTHPDARIVPVWWALVPAAISFSPSWSTLYPLVSVVAFWMMVVGFERPRSDLWWIGSGLVTGIGTFINFAFLPLPLFLGVYTLLRCWPGQLSRAIRVAIGYGVGLLLPWLIFQLVGGQSVFELLQTSMRFHLSLDRPYWFWVWMHPWDWVMWTGVGFALLWLTGVWMAVRARRLASIPILGLSLLISMLVLTLSGTARGETGRVWLFFSPFMLIAALDGLKRLAADNHWLTFSLAQGVWVVVIIAALNVVGTNFTPPPNPPQVNVSQPVDATFSTQEGGPLFRLTGWEGQSGNNQLDLRLRWEGVAPMTTPYWFTAVLVAPDGQTLRVDPWQPGGATRYPTTCWSPGQTLGDEVRLPLPPNAAKGDWWVSLAVYGDTDASENGRLIVTQPGQNPDSQIGLGPINVQ
jgi:hypothetical protein